MTTSTYSVQGLTCGLCVGEVMEQVRLVPGVTGLRVALVRGGPSPLIVTSAAAAPGGDVRRAVELAGFELAGPDPDEESI